MNTPARSVYDVPNLDPPPAFSPNMLELLREHTKIQTSIRTRGAVAPGLRRVAELIPQIRERAKDLLVAALDEFHGQDPTVEAETRAYLLWEAVNR